MAVLVRDPSVVYDDPSDIQNAYCYCSYINSQLSVISGHEGEYWSLLNLHCADEWDSYATNCYNGYSADYSSYQTTCSNWVYYKEQADYWKSTSDSYYANYESCQNAATSWHNWANEYYREGDKFKGWADSQEHAFHTKSEEATYYAGIGAACQAMVAVVALTPFVGPALAAAKQTEALYWAGVSGACATEAGICQTAAIANYAIQAACYSEADNRQAIANAYQIDANNYSALYNDAYYNYYVPNHNAEVDNYNSMNYYYGRYTQEWSDYEYYNGKGQYKRAYENLGPFSCVIDGGGYVSNVCKWSCLYDNLIWTVSSPYQNQLEVVSNGQYLFSTSPYVGITNYNPATGTYSNILKNR